jgi:hypothetical protein
MSENHYESIRDSNIVPPSVREKVIYSEQARRGLRQTYEKLQDDQDLTLEAKQRLAQEAFERNKDRVVEKNQEAREGLINAAKAKEKSAVPKPPGVSLTTEDPTRLLLIQGEADRVRRIADKRGNHPLGGGARIGDFLRSEYKRGVEELSGAEAQARCAGVLRAAEELGVSEEEVVGSLRTDQQRETLDEARRLYYMSDMFSKDAPAPPRQLSRAASRARQTADRHPVFMPQASSTEPVAASEPAHGSASPPRPAGKKRRAKPWK